MLHLVFCNPPSDKRTTWFWIKIESEKIRALKIRTKHVAREAWLSIHCSKSHVSSCSPSSAQSEFPPCSLQGLPIFLLWRWKVYFSMGPYRHPGWGSQGRKKGESVWVGNGRTAVGGIRRKRPWQALEKACGDWPSELISNIKSLVKETAVLYSDEPHRTFRKKWNRPELLHPTVR